MAGKQPAADICLVVLVGLPGSGKTTLANFVKQHFSTNRDNNLSFNVIHVCYDSFITIASSHLDSADWQNARKEMLVLVEKILYLLKDIGSEQDICTIELTCGSERFIKQDCKWNVAVKKRTILIIDDNMYYRSMRYSYFQLTRRHNIGFCQLYLNCTVPAAIDSNKSRSECERIPDAVVQKMAERMEPPQNKPWEKCSLTIPTHVSFSNENLVIQLESLISKALLNPTQPINDFHVDGEASRQACMSSVIHQADLALRHLISERITHLQMTNADSNEIRAQPHILNAARSKILDALKTREILIPEDACLAVQLSDPSATERLRCFLFSLLPQ